MRITAGRTHILQPALSQLFAYSRAWGVVRMPEGPGLGIESDRAALTRFAG